MTPAALEAEGWRSITTEGFTGEVGPFWVRHEDGDVAMGLIVEPRHANSHIGTLHGGVVMTFADIALGSGAANLLGEARLATVTASMETKFVATAKIGEFISCKPEVIKETRHLVFVRGLIKAGDNTIASCEGIWKKLQSPQ